MFKNYIKITFRNIIRERGYSFINITGLAIGMTACILILFWVFDELNYDKFHKKAENIHRINKKYQMGTEIAYNRSTPFPLAKTLQENFAEVQYATKFQRNTILVKYEDKIFSERRACLTDSSFFNVFSFEFVKSNFKTALAEPNSMIITEEIAQKYFGDSDPIGQILTVDNRKEYIVTGIIKNIPNNSSIRFDIFCPFSNSENPTQTEDWGNHFYATFVRLLEKTSVDNFNQKLDALAKERLPQEQLSFQSQPLSKIYLYSIEGEPTALRYIIIFTIIASFILVIACINFMNLSTARSAKRAKEVGLRKVIGANRSQIILQFFGESIIYIIVSLIIAFILVEICLSGFNNLTGKTLTLDYTSIKMIGGLFMIAIFTGLFAGSYPALFLSSFQPVKVLKGSFGNNRKGSLRKVLVVIQFTMAIILMISTGIIYSQLKYIQNKDLGFNKENIVYLNLNEELIGNYDAFKSELEKHSDIQGVTKTSELPNNINTIMRGITWEGKETPGGAAFGFASVDYGYFNMMDMEIVRGRGFAQQFTSDSTNAIINETAARMIGYDNPVGKQLILDEETSLTIVGIVKDFNSMPLNYNYEPVLMMIYPNFYRQVMIKINSNTTEETLVKIEENWKQFSPGFPFEYHFFDEVFEMSYRNEIRMGKILGYFVFLAIFISCLGLFGLASYTAEQRKKEIGVRKVQGATVSSIIVLLSQEFAKWVLIANVIAWPVAYFAMDKWLQSFAFRTKLSLNIFIASGVVALIIALLTVGYQAIKAAIQNPVKVLRYE